MLIVKCRVKGGEGMSEGRYEEKRGREERYAIP